MLNRTIENPYRNVFRKIQVELKKGQKIPALNESQPLSIIYHADLYLNEKISKCFSKKKRNHIDEAVKKVRSAQKTILDLVWVIFQDLDDELRAARPNDPRFRNPAQPVFMEHVLYAAQCIACRVDVQIRGLFQEYHQRLEHEALCLHSEFIMLRKILLEKAIENTLGPYDRLIGALVRFDKAFVDFEIKLAARIAESQRMVEIQKYQKLMVYRRQLHHTITYCLQKKLFTRTEIIEMDPDVIYGLGRFLVLDLLRLKITLDWFNLDKLKDIQQESIEKMFPLVLGSRGNTDDKLWQEYLQVCTVADVVHSEHAAAFTNCIQKVFQHFSNKKL